MAEAEETRDPVSNLQHQNGLNIQYAEESSRGASLEEDKAVLRKGQEWTEIKVEDAHAHPSEDAAIDAEQSTQVPQSDEQDEVAAEMSQEGVSSQDSLHSELPQEPPPPPEKDHPVKLPPSPDKPSLAKPPTISNGISEQSRSRSGTETTGAKVSKSPISSMVFVVAALEQIAASKDARRKKQLGESVNKVLVNIKQQEAALSPEDIFEPLRLATETSSIPLTTTALDCIGKLISYSYFSIPLAPIDSDTVSQQPPKPPLIERAIETICDCFQDEATPAEVQLQIVKSLLAAVLNDKIIVHGAGLLKAVRQVYNIFLFSKSTANQQVAQGTLTQMVGTVFERVTVRLSMKEARIALSRTASGKGTANASQVDLNGTTPAVDRIEPDGSTEADPAEVDSLPQDHPVRKDPGVKLTLQSFENAKSFDDARIDENAPTMVTRARSAQKAMRSASGSQSVVDEEQSTSDEDEEDEIFVKDAFLVFRSMCRLSTKILPPDQQQDIKSSNMRSKLVTLSIIRTLLNNNMVVFVSPLVVIRSSTNNEPTGFGQAINQYLRLSLSRNGASSVRQVFETCSEIFWLMLKDMRVMLKVGGFWKSKQIQY